MPGLYIHIPFCKVKCPYCDFYSLAGSQPVDVFVTALKQEFADRAGEVQGKTVDTIYIGGGTPSLLSFDELKDLFSSLYKSYSVSASAEVTLEVNPDDVSDALVQSLVDLPVNRVSIGVQAVFDDLLHFLGRRHSAEKSAEAVEVFHKAGFTNLSIDLIYALPGLDDIRWQQTLDRVSGWPVSHISAYALTVEQGTRLHRWVNTGKTLMPDENTFERQYRMLLETSAKAGWRQYEISNFAYPGCESKHNSAYWAQVPYIGFGPSAHSYNGQTRRNNTASLKKYIEGAGEGQTDWYHTEQLSPVDCFNEFLLTRLRTVRGLSVAQLHEKFAPYAWTFITKIQTDIDAGFLVQSPDGFLQFTTEGQLISDYLISKWMATAIRI